MMKDTAMRIATGNLTTDSVGYAEFMSADYELGVLEIFEDLPEDFYIRMIANLYMDIYEALKKENR